MGLQVRDSGPVMPWRGAKELRPFPKIIRTFRRLRVVKFSFYVFSMANLYFCNQTKSSNVGMSMCATIFAITL